MHQHGIDVFKSTDYFVAISKVNKSAIALYKKLGFQLTGREPFGLKLPNGKFLVDLTMTLKT